MDNLPEKFDAEAVYESRVLPALGVQNGGADAPVWISIGGQQGSGKTTVRKRLVQELGEGRTQLIAGDDFEDFLPDEADIRPEAGDRKKVLSRLRMLWTERLIDRACKMRANVIWEQPVPNYVMEFAAIARMLGYRIECKMLALPALESWLATVRRHLARLESSDLPQSHISWRAVTEAYHRWPAFLALAEDRVAFDRITVLNRDGEMYFDNHSKLVGEKRKWEGPTFAFESLIVERNQARSAAAVATLVAEWQKAKTDPRLTSISHSGWVAGDLQAFDYALSSMCNDLSTGFDLNQPDPALAKGWLARLKADLDATLATRDAGDQKTLAARGERLIALVSQVAGQPIR